MLAGLALLAAGYFLVKGYTWKLIRTERSFDLLILLGTLVLPLLSAFPLNAIGLTVPTNASGVRNLVNPDVVGIQAYTSLIGMIAVVVLMFLIAIAIGLWWNWRLWLANFALFYTVFIVFYTTFFTNGAGFATGLVGSLGYWLEQQGVNRGSQPWYYYAFVQIPIYEYLPALGCILAVALGLFRKQSKSSDIVLDSPQGDAPETDNETAPALALFGFWTISSLVAYTIAGEKMPWLTVHIALPMLLLTGWAIGYLIDTTDWKAVRTGRGFLILAVLVVFLASVAGTLGSLLGSNPPFQGKELVQLQSTSTFLLSFVAMIASGWGLIYLLRGWETQQIVRLFTLAFAGILTILTARTAFTASYINYDYAKEFLVYAHSGPGIKTALTQIEEISRRTTDGLALAVAYDDKTTYPYWWYLRNYPSQQFFSNNPTRNLREVPAILVGDANYSKIEPVVGEAYYPYEYVRMWWPTQDYFGLTWQRIYYALTNRDMREALFRIWLNRDFSKYAAIKGKDMSLPNWDPAERFRLYLRKDVAAKMWNYGTSPAPAEIVADPYENKGVVLEADIVLGQAGSHPGQFTNPHNVAIAPDGTLYVLDSGNARVQHLSRLGNVLQVWGSFADNSQGNAPGGAFNDPWGIAVGPDGSVYVADTWNHRIQKFTPEGEFIKMWGYGISQTDDPFGFYGPRGIAVDANGYVYVADTGNDRLIVFDSDGEYVNKFGGEGYGPGQFDEPTGVTVSEEGWLFVTDTWNQRIQSFAPAGGGTFTPDNSWDISGWYGRSLKNYPYVAVDRDGHLYTTDPEGVRVLAYTTQGDFLYYWGEYGSGYDQFLLPQGVAVDPEGGVWVVDTENNRVMHFKLPTDSGASEDTGNLP